MFGDSRAYLVRKGLFTQLSRDHSWGLIRQVRAGLLTETQARTMRSAMFDYSFSRVRRLKVDIDVLSRTIARRDTLVLCSDGLSCWSAMRELRCLLTSCAAGKRVSLVRTCNENCVPDNLTAIVLVRCRNVGVEHQVYVIPCGLAG